MCILFSYLFAVIAMVNGAYIMTISKKVYLTPLNREPITGTAARVLGLICFVGGLLCCIGVYRTAYIWDH